MQQLREIAEQYIHMPMSEILEDGIGMRLYSSMIRSVYDRAGAVLSDIENRMIDTEDHRSIREYREAIGLFRRLVTAHGSQFIQLMRSIGSLSPFEDRMSTIYHDTVRHNDN